MYHFIGVGRGSGVAVGRGLEGSNPLLWQMWHYI